MRSPISPTACRSSSQVMPSWVSAPNSRSRPPPQLASSTATERSPVSAARVANATARELTPNPPEAPASASVCAASRPGSSLERTSARRCDSSGSSNAGAPSSAEAGSNSSESKPTTHTPGTTPRAAARDAMCAPTRRSVAVRQRRLSSSRSVTTSRSIPRASVVASTESASAASRVASNGPVISDVFTFSLWEPMGLILRFRSRVWITCLMYLKNNPRRDDHHRSPAS